MSADWITWHDGLLAGLLVGVFAAHVNLKRRIAEMRPKYLPRLRATGVAEKPFHIYAGATAVSSGKLYNVLIVNDPETSTADAVATDIRPRLTFVSSSVERLALDGRWDNTPQPKPFEPKLVPTTLGIGEERALHIVVKFPDDECAYAYNNYSYDHPGMKSPAYRLTEREYHVAVRVRGVGVDATTHVLLKQALDGSDPVVRIISHQERP